MKTLKQIREASGGKEAYQKFFNSLLKKFGVSSPSELKGDKKKEFYDAIDAGWEGDNEKPEKNETYGDPDNLDPDTTTDPDEEEINASYGKKKMMASYHKESEDIGSSHPKPLSIIRQVKEFSGDAETVRRKKRRFENMVMCEHCGKMHEEGACMEMDNDLDPETKGMEEAKTVKLNRPEKNIFDLAMKAIARSNDAAKARTKRGVEKYMDYEGMDLIDDITGVSLTDNEKNNVYNAVRDALNAKTRESVEEANRLSVKLKGNASKLFDLAKKQGIKNKAYGDKEWNKAVDQAADEMGKKVNFKDIAAVKQAMMHESIKEAKEAKLSPSMKNQIHKIAKKHSGDMEAAMKEISKMKVWKGQGIKDHSYVMDTLKTHNEDVNEGVAVDRRTKGFKAAMIRSEKAKKVREKAKKKKEAKKDQAELDARYDYDGEVDNIISAASKVMMGKREASIIKNPITNETAANAVAHGGVDMAPNAGKKKKDKEKLMARRGY